jgi:hypothetical protein
MFSVKKTIFFSLILILSGCVTKSSIKKENQESAFIKIITPKIKYADMGFIYKGDSWLKVEIYAMGQPVVEFNINGVNICMSSLECMDKSDFNEKMLSEFYPSTLLENIFRGKAIFNGKNLRKSSSGFIQTIRDNKKYDITYEVRGKSRKFYDKINKIKIEVIGR